jgi:hypothetical protein
MSTQDDQTRAGLGANSGFLMEADARLQTARITTKLPMLSVMTVGRGIACLGVR